MSIEIVKPIVVDNVEFYVSSDGTQSGISQSVLLVYAELIVKIFRKLSEMSLRQKQPQKR